jgi:hypothetical protein
MLTKKKVAFSLGCAAILAIAVYGEFDKRTFRVASLQQQSE